jgi:SAM-dependent methyltransferase
MQGYGPSFARVYNLRWTTFTEQLAPRLRTFYESTPVGRSDRRLLDLCCGTGQFALHFLDHGYQVTGLDLSESMLTYAKANTAPYIVAGQARFVQADAAHFALAEQFGLVVSTFDALNHLPDFEALRGCFLSVWPLLVAGGLFIFDLNTLYGLRRWTGVSVSDTPEMMLIIRSLFDEQTRRGYTRISGFLPAANGLYERFEETAYNTAFNLEPVRQALLEAGFRAVRFARGDDFTAPVTDPEAETRIYFIAEK